MKNIINIMNNINLRVLPLRFPIPCSSSDCRTAARSGSPSFVSPVFIINVFTKTMIKSIPKIASIAKGKYGIPWISLIFERFNLGAMGINKNGTINQQTIKIFSNFLDFMALKIPTKENGNNIPKAPISSRSRGNCKPFSQSIYWLQGKPFFVCNIIAIKKNNPITQ